MTHDILVGGTATIDDSPVSGATVVIVNEDNQTVEATLQTDENGEYRAYVPEGTNIHVLFQHDDGNEKYNDISYPQYTVQGDAEASANVADDFGDGSLSNRDDFSTLSWGGPQPTSNFVTSTRPSWTVNNGSASVSDGSLSFGATSSDVNTPSSQMDNVTWEYKFHRNSASGDSSFAPCDTGDGVDGGWQRQPYNGYEINHHQDNPLRFRRVDQGSATSLIEASSRPSTPYTIDVRLTRDDTGYWELYIDGTLIGSVTDTTYGEADKAQLFASAGERGTDFEYRSPFMEY